MTIVISPAFSSTTARSIHKLHHSTSATELCNLVQRRQTVTFSVIQLEFSKSPLYFNQPRGRDHKRLLKPICAAGSALELAVGDAPGSTITLKTVEIAIESRDADKINLRFDLPADETQKAFDVILSKLARSAPPTPGFRSQKGGKTSKIPKNLLIDILGRDRVMKFVIREIVTSAVADYLEKEKLVVKDKKMKTTQTEDELKKTFVPGSAFGFNAEIELVTEENETASTNS